MAAPKAKIQEFIDILAGFEQDILADDADIGGTILYIGRYVGRLGDDELYFLLLIGDDELARFIG